MPRQDGNTNGRIAEYSIEISNDGKTWSEVTKGKFANTDEIQLIPFDKSVQARYFRLIALSEQGGRDYASIAELDIIPDKK